MLQEYQQSKTECVALRDQLRTQQRVLQAGESISKMVVHASLTKHVAGVPAKQDRMCRAA
jgi:hypothetical protein